MKNKISYLIITLFLFICAPIACFAHMPASVDGQKVPSLAPMLAKITPAVVNIAVEKQIPPTTNSFESQVEAKKIPPRFLAGVGSGVIINAKKGLIITNAHVVSNEKVMLVTLKDGRRFRAKLVGKDDGFDIAIIKIPAINLTSIPFGDSDQLKVGDFVAAIGSPFGLTQTVTSGVISALNRSQPQIEGFQSFIQTDAPINMGNSGGALVNLKGQLVGINTAIVSPSFGNIGIGFAIPSNMVHSVVSQLLKYGKVERGVLGVIAQNITPELASALNLKHQQGVLVTKVMPGSPANEAGFKDEDIILKVNGKVIRSAAQLHNTLGLMRPGTPITIDILRHHEPMALSATVGNPKKMLKQRAMPFLAGMRLQNFKEFEPDGKFLKGAIVVSIADSSPDALAGLLPGDVITQANSQKINSVKDLEKIVMQHPKELLVKVDRGNASLFLVVQPQ